jgi:putative endonuclease
MSHGKGGCVYIITNKNHLVLYTGVTSDLYSRMVQHIEKQFPKSFSAKYNCTKLVYFAPFHSIEEAIAEEKRIKGGNRQQKINLIESQNPEWNDLWEIVQKW